MQLEDNQQRELQETAGIRTCQKWKWRTKNCRVSRHAKASIKSFKKYSEEQRAVKGHRESEWVKNESAEEKKALA